MWDLHCCSTLVPCTPTNQTVSVGCSQDSARFTWTSSIGSIFYVVVAVDANGYSYSCNSMGTTCLMEGLRCGQNYTASIVGSNLQCNSSSGRELAFMTGILRSCLNSAYPTEVESAVHSSFDLVLQRRVLRPTSRRSETATPTTL